MVNESHAHRIHVGNILPTCPIECGHFEANVGKCIYYIYIYMDPMGWLLRLIPKVIGKSPKELACGIPSKWPAIDGMILQVPPLPRGC